MFAAELEVDSGRIIAALCGQMMIRRQELATFQTGNPNSLSDPERSECFVSEKTIHVTVQTPRMAGVMVEEAHVVSIIRGPR